MLTIKLFRYGKTLDLMRKIKMVEVIWHGHACFEIRGKDVTIVADPFTGIGLPEPVASADIVLCSHSHRDHNNVAPVKKNGGVVLELFVGSQTVNNLSVKGVASFHDDSMGTVRGKNSIYVFTVDGVTFCHLGDLGHVLSPQQVKEIGKIDVLFVPIGGFFTIGPETAESVYKALGPKIVIPMHYKRAGMSPNFDKLHTLDDFLAGKVNVKKIDASSMMITKEALPGETTIIALSLK